METEALEYSLSALNVALNVSIGAVVLGLVLEYAPEFFSELHATRCKWVERVGAILVIAGVAGELLLHIRSEQIDNQIKSIQRTAIARLFDRATAAEKSSALANERAANAEKATAEAALKLEQMKRDRIINQVQVDSLTTKLLPFAGKKFWIVTQANNQPPGTSEQDALAAQLSRIFLSAKWISDPHTYRNDADKTDPATVAVGDRGCYISIASDSPLGDIKMSVIQDLAKSGIECGETVDPIMRPDVMVFELGLR